MTNTNQDTKQERKNLKLMIFTKAQMSQIIADQKEVIQVDHTSIVILVCQMNVVIRVLKGSCLNSNIHKNVTSQF